MLKRNAILFAAILLITVTATAQKDESTRKSPPEQISAKVGPATITIDYSRPAKRGRRIFGELEEYGKVWRTGANETTWIELDRDVKVEGKALPAGKYGLFTIPGPDEWIIIFNEKWDGWGAYEYNLADDVLRVKVKPETIEDEVEVLTIEVTNEGIVSISWDQTRVRFSIK